MGVLLIMDVQEVKISAIELGCKIKRLRGIKEFIMKPCVSHVNDNI